MNDSQPQFRLRQYLRPAAAWLIAVGLLAAVVVMIRGGCTVDPEQNVARSQVTKDLAQPVDDLTLAMEALADLPSAKDEQPQFRALHYLNQWIRQQDEVPVDEKLDPLLENLPRSYRETALFAILRRRMIDDSDLRYLLQCKWLRDVGLQVSKQKPNPELVPWLAEQEQVLGVTDAQKLAAAERLFDWTVRNIQLDEMPPPPAPPKATTAADDPRAKMASLPAPVRGDVGPGYGHLPWQTLVYGHGDAWERSRVFLLLARQADMQVVMLGVPEAQNPGATRPWLPALLLRDQLFLFDAELGVPIPGPGGRGIATLQQVAEDPSLLTVLSPPGASPYRVAAEELKSVTALIDAEPWSLSIRMRLLETALPSDMKLVLHCRPSEVEKQLRQCPHVATVSLWRVPLDAVFYNEALGYVSQANPEVLEKNLRDSLMFSSRHGLLPARHLHLIGHYETPADESQIGARQSYLTLRPSEKEIEAIADSQGRMVMGFRESDLPTNPEDRKKMLDRIMSVTRASKHHATYWIALSHFETGDYEVAAEWFRDRVLEGAPDSPWHGGASYNLGRCYEALGRWREAYQTYVSDESPQRAGNLLRAAWIARKHPEVLQPASKETEPAQPPGQTTKEP